MTYFVGDNSSSTFPVYDTNGGSIDFGDTVVAHNSAGDQVTINADWEAPAGPVPDADPEISPTPTVRQLVIPHATLPKGLWGLVLSNPDGEDVFLGNVVIQ